MVCEPFYVMQKRIAIPVENGRIANKFGRAGNFIIFEIKEGKWKEIKRMENKYKRKKIRAGLAIAKELIDEGINEVITKEIGEIAYHALKDGNIKIYYGSGSIDEVIEKYKKGELHILKEPKKVE